MTVLPTSWPDMSGQGNPRRMRQWIAIGMAAGLLGLGIVVIRNNGSSIGDLLSKKVPSVENSANTSKKVDPPPLEGLDLTKIDSRENVSIAPAHGNRKAELTLVSKYQNAAMAFLKASRAPESVIVMTDVKTGNIITWASVVQNGAARDLAVEAIAPAASVFKIVTGTALIEAGLTPATKQCYTGGEHSIRASDLIDDPKRDKWCATLSQAMGRSLNTVFARLAQKHLEQKAIEEVAARYGWGQDLPFDVKVQPSTLTFPEDKLGYARTAAGFWNSTLSPFEGVNLATTIANGGEMLRLHLVSSVKDESGEIYKAPAERQVIRRVIEPNTAAAMTKMMEATVTDGTSYKSFHDRSGLYYLGDVSVAGKTGTLTKPQPEGPFYTWFVGFAPSNKPEVAISVLVANGAKWRVKATNLASDMLRVYFADKNVAGVNDPREPKKKKIAKKR